MIGFKNKNLEQDLIETISDLNNSKDFTCEIKVSVYDINTKKYASVNENNLGWAASIIKVPVMVATLQEIEKGKLSLEEQLKTNHKFMLENYDYVSRLPDNSNIRVLNLLYYMIANSDNEATNILADKVGIEKINKMMLNLGMKNSMLGHLLCPNVPRYTSKFNLDGSNVTSPLDMVTIFRHIYEDSFSKLSPYVRAISDSILSFTSPSYLNKDKFISSRIKAKVGYISDELDGADIHEVGIINDHLIVCVMLNKFKENFVPKLINSNPSVTSVSQRYLDDLRFLEGNFNLSFEDKKFLTSENKIYTQIMKTIGRYY